jgi:hypothetical protein
MTQPFDHARDGLRAAPAPGTTAAGGTGPGVPLSIWPGLPDPGRVRESLPCGGPVTTAAARRVIDAFCAPGDLIAAVGGLPAVTEAAAAAGRRVLTLVPGPPLLARPVGEQDDRERDPDAGQERREVGAVDGRLAAGSGKGASERELALGGVSRGGGGLARRWDGPDGATTGTRRQ